MQKKNLVLIVIICILTVVGLYSYVAFKMIDQRGLPIPSMDTPQDTPQSSQGVFYIEKNKEGTKFFIKKDDKVLKEVDAYEGEGPVDYLDIFKNTSEHAYIGRFLEPMIGESPLYKPGPVELFIIDVKDDSVKDVALNQGGTVVAVSPSESTLFYTIQKQERTFLAMRSLTGYSEIQFPLPIGYNQFGDFHISPDGKDLAFGAVKGIKGQEQGAVFIIKGLNKFGNKETELLKESTEPNTYFKILGWKNNSEVDYQLIEI